MEGIQSCRESRVFFCSQDRLSTCDWLRPCGHGLLYPNLSMPYPEAEIPPMPREVFSHKGWDSCFNNPPCFYYFWRLSKGVKNVHLTPAEIQQISLLQEMYLCKYRIIFDPLHPVTHILLMTRRGGLEDRHECSLLYSTSSFSSAAFLQQRISHLGLLGIHQTFLLHVFSCDLFTSFLLDPEIFFSLSSPSVLLVHKCVGCTEACTWWDLTGSISPGQIRISLFLTAHISLPQNAVLHVILILTVKAALKSHLGLLVMYWLKIPCFKEG